MTIDLVVDFVEVLDSGFEAFKVNLTTDWKITKKNTYTKQITEFGVLLYVFGSDAVTFYDAKTQEKIVFKVKNPHDIANIESFLKFYKK
jgi:hypothetical protein